MKAKTMVKIAIAGFQHETNTFAPGSTTMQSFEDRGGWPGLTRGEKILDEFKGCLLYTSPSPRDGLLSRMPSSA